MKKVTVVEYKIPDEANLITDAVVTCHRGEKEVRNQEIGMDDSYD